MAEFPIRANTGGANADIDALIAKLTQLGKTANLSQKEIDDITASTRKLKSEGSQGFDALNQGMSKLNGLAQSGAQMIGAYFAVDKAKEFISEVVNITAEFQKFQAVLTNTLGSKGLANAALSDIQKLAAQTPFSVRELTENFIKLANRGVQPTIEQMRKMGDLAATLGKPFEDIVEALLDINNQERWKNIGIQAQTAGDKVTLSFRGANIQVDRTVQGVTDAAIKLGELEGVAGSMKAISETLGGQISNLGDSWDQFLNTVGDGNKGIFSTFISLANDAVQAMTNIMKTAEQMRTEAASSKFANSKGWIEEQIKLGMNPQKAVEMETATLDNRILEKREQLAELEAKQDTQVYGMGQKLISNKTMEIAKLKEEISVFENAKATVIDYGKSLSDQSDATQKALDDKAAQAAADAHKKRLKEIEKEWEQLRAFAKQYANQVEDAFYAKSQFIDANKVKKDLGFGEKPEDLNLQPDADTGGIDDAELARIKARVKANQDADEARKQGMKEVYSLGQQLGQEFFSWEMTQIQNEITALNNRYSSEIQAAGNNTDAKKKLQNDYNKQMAQLQNKQNAMQKEQAIFGIIVNQGPAIAKAMASVGFPLNLIIGGLVAGMFALILGNTKSVATPRAYAKGVFNLDGPGTETSDSILSGLSKGESVASAKVTRNFKDVLQPMIEDPNFGWSDLKKVANEKVPTLDVPIIMMPHITDTGEVLSEIKGLRQDLANKKVVHINIDENGLAVLHQEADQWTKFVNKRYRRSV